MKATIIGPMDGGQRRRLREAASKAGADVVHLGSGRAGVKALQAMDEAPACVFATQAADAQLAAELLRDTNALFGVPLIMLLECASDIAYRRAYEVGVDDVVALSDPGGITRRLANLRDYDPRVRPAPSRGLAIVATRDPAQRRCVGRSLRRVGYDIAFAEGRSELQEEARLSAPSLVVTTPSFPPADADPVLQAVGTDAGSPVPSLVLQPVAGAAASHMNIERLMFEVDEFLRGPIEARASKRIMHSAMCSFRLADSMDAAYATTYNISQQGLYLRTFDPLPRESRVFIELRTPAGKVIRLAGEVVWHRPLGDAANMAPAGFGVRILTQCTAASDLTQYERFYANALREQHNQGVWS